MEDNKDPPLSATLTQHSGVTIMHYRSKPALQAKQMPL
jgi:hypothetical protein